MPTYLNSVAATAPTYEPLGKEVACAWNVITMATGDLALNASTPAVRLPRGARVLRVDMSCTDMDTSGSPALVFDVGDAADTDRFIDGTTVGQTGGSISSGNVAGSAATLASHTAYTTETVISILAQAAAATAAAGTIFIAVYYVCE